MTQSRLKQDRPLDIFDQSKDPDHNGKKPFIETRDQEYIRIATAILIRVNGNLPFDIYIERAHGKFTKIFHCDQALDVSQVKRYYEEKKVKYFYVHNASKDTYSHYVEKLLEASLAEPNSLTPQAMRSILNEMVNISLESIYSKTDVDQKGIQFAATAVKGCTQLLENDFDGLCRIMKMLATRPFSLKHSFMVSIFSLLLARGLEYESERTLLNLGIGALLHDIGMTRVKPELVTKVDLSAEEFKEIKEHTHLGVRIVDSIKKGITSEIRCIILQHHEQPNGYGYPNALIDREIYPLAKIVTIADVFCSLISESPYGRSPIKTNEAIKHMLEERGRFDQGFLQVFAKIVMPNPQKNENDQEVFS
jgi:putative nucleotidyltransferase with HDIG domain